MSLKIYVSKNKLVSLFMVLLLGSCSTMNSTWDSISEAGDYIYDSVVFWEDDEPEQEQAIVIEEAIEVPEFAVPEQTFESQIYSQRVLQVFIDTFICERCRSFHSNSL